MATLSQEERAQCVFMDRLDIPQTEIARKLKRSRYAVQLALSRYDETGDHKDRPRPGAARITSPRDDRLLVRKSLENRRATVPQLRSMWQTSGVTASNTTVRRRLR